MSCVKEGKNRLPTLPFACSHQSSPLKRCRKNAVVEGKGTNWGWRGLPLALGCRALSVTRARSEDGGMLSHRCGQSSGPCCGCQGAEVKLRANPFSEHVTIGVTNLAGGEVQERVEGG